MRWLALFRRFRSAHRRILRSTFAGVSSLAHEGPAWLEGALGTGLERATSTWLAAEPPFLLDETCAVGSTCACNSRPRMRPDIRRGGRPVPDRGRRSVTAQSAASAATSRCRDRVERTTWQSLPPERPRFGRAGSAVPAELNLGDRVAVDFIGAVGSSACARRRSRGEGSRPRRRRRHGPASRDRSPAACRRDHLDHGDLAMAALMPSRSIIVRPPSASAGAPWSIPQRDWAMRSRVTTLFGDRSRRRQSASSRA